ncbi:BZ3500_MvSof-1268-A1-R1_Chr3-1g05842 [Microbotryum saponariae]|uniref:BZ3500_MvSof-1268-A1-R1_Chr3-1g05842 protein n=1 Tax=Microbotryum saponariae TaxID=289078 RepID=A0A2X0NBV1_9BASI|nr:BZ3500_MvSof-1268-A1-R1_Chr3-1g05842 [Microbotryum saponariae]SDA05032.1 BZ3501_MvSof-1269-A2-R1_Chr3-1g05512 [Microbotryum saponariae]
MSLCLSFLLFHTALAIAAPVPLRQARDVDPSHNELEQPNNTPSVDPKSAIPSLSSSASDDAKNSQAKQDGSKSRKNESMGTNSWSGGTTYSGMKKLRRRRVSVRALLGVKPPDSLTN